MSDESIHLLSTGNERTGLWPGMRIAGKFATLPINAVRRRQLLLLHPQRVIVSGKRGLLEETTKL